MEENQVRFLPFNAINEFMRDDFRLKVIRSVLTRLDSLPKSLQDPINHITRKVVQVPGFRNSEKAPATVKLLPMASAFQKSPELTALVLSAWAELHGELRDAIYGILKQRGWPLYPDGITDPAAFAGSLQLNTPADWKVLPPQADRTRLPGFLTFWPGGQSYDEIYDEFIRQYPQAEGSVDETSLMAIWLSLRLPYQVGETIPAPGGAEPQAGPDVASETGNN